MTSDKSSNPYISDLKGTVLENITVLSDALNSQGYDKNTISQLAVTSFLENERVNISQETPLHLLAIKKALLYAIPVIAPKGQNSGVSLTSQVSTPAIKYDTKKNKSKRVRLAVGDRFRLIGFMFPKSLINHLSMDVFPWKHSRPYFFEYPQSPIDISDLQEIDTFKTNHGNIYVIRQSSLENGALYNKINRLLAFKLIDEASFHLSLKPREDEAHLTLPKSMKPLNDNKLIDKLNEILPHKINKGFTTSFYETLQMTGNWLLYDQINLLGFESVEVKALLTKLKYIKEQTLKVQQNSIATNKQKLLSSLAEKIARERYPQYFDFKNRNAMFVRFNRFDLNRLPKKEQSDINLILKKEIDAQEAILHNKCEHLNSIQNVREFSSDFVETFKELESFIDYDRIDDNKMYPCKLCSYPLVCMHTVELYELLESSKRMNDNINDLDGLNQSRQQILNKYRLTNQQRIGDEGTDVSYTFYCKYCSAELGKSTDSIQATMKTLESSSNYENDPIETMIYSSVFGTINTKVNRSVIQMDRKTITKLVFSEVKDEVKHKIDISSDIVRDNLDILIKYLTQVYTLAALIVINNSLLKSAESILIDSSKSDLISRDKQDSIRDEEPVDEEVSGGKIDVKQELVSAFNIIQANPAYKQIGITHAKIKTMLLAAFKSMNLSFSNVNVEFKLVNASDRLKMDILSSPLTRYAQFMKMRDCSCEVDALEAAGIDMDALFPKTKAKKAEKIEKHSLYRNIFRSTKKESTDIGRYIQEAYQSIVDAATQEPISGRYFANENSPISDFARTFEHKRTNYLNLKRTVPILFLPVENHRDYDFALKNYQLAYCLPSDNLTRTHRWKATKKDKKNIYTCAYCKLNIENASIKNNSKIEDALDEKRTLEAFFELYTVSCPVKDTHLFENAKCLQCEVRKEDITNMDKKYFQKYAKTYLNYRDTITKGILEDAQSIVKSSKMIKKSDITNPTPRIKPDMIKLESLSFSLSKIYSIDKLESIGYSTFEGSAGTRSLELIDSYIRLFYSHYTFAKNISLKSHIHPDPAFTDFIKDNFFERSKPKNVSLPDLPAYPVSSNADQLLIEFFEMIQSLSTNDSAKMSDILFNLIKFILSKIITQKTRHEMFNFAKLRSATSEEDFLEIEESNEDLEEDEFDMFDGYDISGEDIEDNIDGDID